MTNTLFRKNRLDLEYHGESQKANAFLILLTTGILAFVGTFLWLKQREFLFIVIFVTFLVSWGGIAGYRKSSKHMKEILNEIERL